MYRIAAGFACPILLTVYLAACRETTRPAPARPAPVEFAAAEKWWLATCGDIEPLQVGHDVTPPVVVKRVDPIWPDILFRMRIDGVLVIQTVIDQRGNVCAARVVRTPLEGAPAAEFSASALAAVRQWTFRPARLNGEPRASVYALTIHFKP